MAPDPVASLIRHGQHPYSAAGNVPRFSVTE